MNVTTDVYRTSQTSRRSRLLPYFLLAVVVIGAIAALMIPVFLATENELGHRSPQSCVDRGGEMQAVSAGLFRGGSRAVCLFPDGTTFKIVPHVEFVDMKTETE